MNWLQRILYKPFFIKLLNWEYWSFNAIYGCILPFWFYYSLKAKSFFFFSASNPTIEYGGFLMESKKKIYDIIPPQYYPKTVFFPMATDVHEVLAQIKQLHFIYPLIGKPDIGGRGRGVKKITTQEELCAYAASSPLDYLIQECVSQAKEVGVFYYRYPNKENGHISGVVRKELLGVTGNGRSSVYQLLLKEKRSILQLPILSKTLGNNTLNEILPAGQYKELVPYGNHARGAKFLDDTHLVDEAFTAAMDVVCKQIDGFFFGRMDIRYNTWEELKQGKNFSIIEVNGAGSEPTHIYDPSHSIFFAWKEIIRHWKILFEISYYNHKKGIPYLSYKEGRKMFKDNSALEKKLDQLYA